MKTKMFLSLLLLATVVPGALAAADEAETKAHTGSHSVLVSPSEDPAVKEEPLVRAGFCAPKAGALLLDGKFPSESGGL